MPIAEYADYDGLGLAELVARGDATPGELVEEAIRQIEAHNPTINAVVHTMYDAARRAASEQGSSGDAPRPFRGVPLLLKDLLGDCAGVPTTYASRLMVGNTADQDHTLVARYKAAGFIPLGKTNASEHGILPTTEPVLYGAARNPWNLEHTVGGSSGGSAAAVAAGFVPIAHANDGAGSIRIPASCCGLVGLKPTRARNPLGPTIGDVMGGLVVEHVVTRTVRDCAAVLDCTHGPEPGDPYAAPAPSRPFLEEVGSAPGQLRIAFSTKTITGASLHPECVAAVENTVRLCQELGHLVDEGAPPIDRDFFAAAFMDVWTAGLTMSLDAFTLLKGRVPTEENLEGLNWSLYRRGQEVTASRYLMAQAMLQICARQIATFYDTYDCWLTPTLAAPPLRLGVIDVNERDIDKAFAPIMDWVPFTPIQNTTGQPAISLPLHWTADGLPVGVMFAGRFGDEATLLRLAAQLEEAQPWRDRKPAVGARA